MEQQVSQADYREQGWLSSQSLTALEADPSGAQHGSSARGFGPIDLLAQDVHTGVLDYTGAPQIFEDANTRNLPYSDSAADIHGLPYSDSAAEMVPQSFDIGEFIHGFSTDSDGLDQPVERNTEVYQRESPWLTTSQPNSEAEDMHTAEVDSLTYVCPPTIPPALARDSSNSTHCYAAQNSSNPEGVPTDTTTSPNWTGCTHRRNPSMSCTIDNVDDRSVTVTHQPDAEVDLNGPIVTFYGIFNENATLDTRQLLTLVPLTLGSAASVPSSEFLKNLAADGHGISLTRFLRQGAVHSTLTEFGRFVSGVLHDDVIGISARSIAIEDRLCSILEAWGKAYMGHHIIGATPMKMADIPAVMKPFENSIEVTVLLAIASQFKLNDPSVTPEKLRKGWRHVFNKERIDWYNPTCITPTISKLTTWFSKFLVGGCEMSLTLIKDDRVFPDLAHYIKLQAWADLVKAILEHAASGGYIHHYEPGQFPPCTAANDPVSYDLEVKSSPGHACLKLARKVGPGRRPGDMATVLLFRHLSLCSLTTWMVNFLVTEGLEDVVEKFVDGTSPFIKTPDVEGNYLPPWSWLVAVSSGFISMTLAAVKSLGYPNLTGKAIVDNADLMELYVTKVACTREVLLDLWMDPRRDTARLHIGWVSRYNYSKALLAIKATRLLTNAPSLYVIWDPESVDIDDVPGFRGLTRNLEFTEDFIDKYRKLALEVDSEEEGENNGPRKILPFSQGLSELYEKSFHIANEQMVERIQKSLHADLMGLSETAAGILGDEMALRIQQLLAAARPKARASKEVPLATSLEDEIDALSITPGPKEKLLEMALSVNQKRVTKKLLPRGYLRPVQRFVFACPKPQGGGSSRATPASSSSHSTSRTAPAPANTSSSTSRGNTALSQPHSAPVPSNTSSSTSHNVSAPSQVYGLPAPPQASSVVPGSVPSHGFASILHNTTTAPQAPQSMDDAAASSSTSHRAPAYSYATSYASRGAPTTLDTASYTPASTSTPFHALSSTHDDAPIASYMPSATGHVSSSATNPASSTARTSRRHPGSGLNPWGSLRRGHGAPLPGSGSFRLTSTHASTQPSSAVHDPSAPSHSVLSHRLQDGVLVPRDARTFDQ